MRIITWNIKQASRTSDAWKLLTALDPDVALLQEIVDIPASASPLFAIRFLDSGPKTLKKITIPEKKLFLRNRESESQPMAMTAFEATRTACRNRVRS